MRSAIRQVLNYFAHFDYPPTIEEIYTFLSQGVSEQKLVSELKSLSKSKEIKIIQNRVYLNHIDADNFKIRDEYSNNLFKDAQNFLLTLRFVPSIQFLGVSGSVSMMNASPGGDIDIFMVVRKGSIWSTRFIIMLYKKIVSICAPSIGSKMCFNLFFAEDKLILPEDKHTEYTGHELFQLRPIFDKNNCHKRLLAANAWANVFFPNVQKYSDELKSVKSQSEQHIIYQYIEKYLGAMQKWWLRVKGYRYLEYPGQVWLIQDDYEEKIEMGE